LLLKSSTTFNNVWLAVGYLGLFLFSFTLVLSSLSIIIYLVALDFQGIITNWLLELIEKNRKYLTPIIIVLLQIVAFVILKSESWTTYQIVGGYVLEIAIYALFNYDKIDKFCKNNFKK